MLLALAGMRLLEILFFAGVAGSSIVVVISFFEDIRELFDDDEDHAPVADGMAAGKR